jgi:hypothetical protein
MWREAGQWHLVCTPNCFRSFPLFFSVSRLVSSLSSLARMPTAGMGGRSRREFICNGKHIHVSFRAMGIHDLTDLPPFSVTHPGVTRGRTDLFCYACSVPMRPPAHNRPSTPLSCTCRHCIGKMAGKVDAQVGTTRICKLACYLDVIAPLS